MRPWHTDSIGWAGAENAREMVEDDVEVIAVHEHRCPGKLPEAEEGKLAKRVLLGLGVLQTDQGVLAGPDLARRDKNHAVSRAAVSDHLLCVFFGGGGVGGGVRGTPGERFRAATSRAGGKASQVRVSLCALETVNAAFKN